LTDYTAQLGGGDDIDRQLSLSAGNDVDRQLAAMKLQLSDNGQSQLESKE